MKTVFEHAVGGDGGTVGLYLDGDMTKIVGAIPTAKLLSPAMDVIDNGINKLEVAIPGDWDKAVLEPIRLAMKAELLALFSGG